MINEVDWVALSRSLGLLDELESGARTESSGTFAAREAIVEIIGNVNIRAAVDFYVSHQPGSELARSVLWLLHPWPAMERCYEIFRLSDEVADRQSAIELLRVVADQKALPWIPEIMNDSDEVVQTWGIGIVDQLAWSEILDAEEVRPLIQLYSNHQNPEVRRTVAFIENYLDERSAAT